MCSLITLACVAGRTRGGKGRREALGSFGRGEGTACKDAIVFLVFYVHQTDVKILIGQILRITQSVVLIGQRPVIQEHRSVHIHSFNMADNASDRLEHLLGGNAKIFGRKWNEIRLKSRTKEGDQTVVREKGSFSRFTYRLWKESNFSASCVAREKSREFCIFISHNAPCQYH